MNQIFQSTEDAVNSPLPSGSTDSRNVRLQSSPHHSCERSVNFRNRMSQSPPKQENNSAQTNECYQQQQVYNPMVPVPPFAGYPYMFPLAEHNCHSNFHNDCCDGGNQYRNWRVGIGMPNQCAVHYPDPAQLSQNQYQSYQVQGQGQSSSVDKHVPNSRDYSSDLNYLYGQQSEQEYLKNLWCHKDKLEEQIAKSKKQYQDSISLKKNQSIYNNPSFLEE
eukprot:TRINITY_DN12131_c0_g3_i1.p1 TRINITY_DN12131_c0_g3~~TRINITY_DN12131_c0_g3_i1.p1  ORF type:complete len:231 (-),score=22.03 TRINITY_DN12131_c0_g3_i1:413-1072(-)